MYRWNRSNVNKYIVSISRQLSKKRFMFLLFYSLVRRVLCSWCSIV